MVGWFAFVVVEGGRGVLLAINAFLPMHRLTSGPQNRPAPTLDLLGVELVELRFRAGA